MGCCSSTSVKDTSGVIVISTNNHGNYGALPLSNNNGSKKTKPIYHPMCRLDKAFYKLQQSQGGLNRIGMEVVLTGISLEDSTNEIIEMNKNIRASLDYLYKMHPALRCIVTDGYRYLETKDSKIDYIVFPPNNENDENEKLCWRLVERRLSVLPFVVFAQFQPKTLEMILIFSIGHYICDGVAFRNLINDFLRLSFKENLSTTTTSNANNVTSLPWQKDGETVAWQTLTAYGLRNMWKGMVIHASDMEFKPIRLPYKTQPKPYSNQKHSKIVNDNNPDSLKQLPSSGSIVIRLDITDILIACRDHKTTLTAYISACLLHAVKTEIHEKGNLVMGIAVNNRPYYNKKYAIPDNHIGMHASVALPYTCHEKLLAAPKYELARNVKEHLNGTINHNVNMFVASVMMHRSQTETKQINFAKSITTSMTNWGSMPKECTEPFGKYSIKEITPYINHAEGYNTTVVVISLGSILTLSCLYPEQYYEKETMNKIAIKLEEYLKDYSYPVSNDSALKEKV